MNAKNLVILIIIILILAVGIGTYFLFQKSFPKSKCGDGICDAKEKADPKLCPEDCYEQDGIIGYLGCSITENAMDGYQRLGGKSFWVEEAGDSDFGGGGLTDWYAQLTGEGSTRTEKDLWSIFENLLKKYPNTNKIWWELCSRAAVADMTYEEALMVLDEIKKMAFGLGIYVTPMPIFLDTRQGKCVDNNGPAIIKGFTDRMVQEGKVKAGPVLRALEKSQTTADGCHANEQGQTIWGRDLMDFFGS